MRHVVGVSSLIKDAGCELVIGARGRGKSTKTKLLIKALKRVVVYDPMGEYARIDIYKRCGSIKEVMDALKRGWKRGFKIAYVPVGDHAQCLHDLCKLLMHVQKPYFDEKDTRQMTLVVEEMNLSFPVTKLSPALYGMQMMTLQGRHYGINVIGVTQRPAEVSATYRGNCECIYVFGLAQGMDFKAVSDTIGREHETKVRALKQHEFLKWQSDGRVELGKNRLS